MLNRIFTNTAKQIRRSGWVAWSSIAVMALAFFVATIFGGLAFLSNLYIQFIETRDNVLVFFEVGYDPERIQALRTAWEVLPQIKSINFTSEEQAYETYLAETEYTKPIEHELLLGYEDKKLNSSLDIQLYSLDDIPTVREKLVTDIESELETVEYDPEEIPILLRIDDQTLDEFREVFSFLRIGGAVVLSLLFVIIFFFTLMTVEFRTFNRMEEIGVMQLVGGSLWYIRAPYILEGGFYGFVGAAVSTLVIGGMALAVFVINPGSALSIFLRERLTILSLPYITAFGWMLIIGIELLLGFLLGSVSSFLAIKRYIK
jgi:cell division transport system permease protein